MIKKLIRYTICLALALSFAIIPAKEAEALSVYDLHTPNSDGYSYVWFGSYPQSEVKNDSLKKAIDAKLGDKSGDCWIDGTKYRKVYLNDAKADYYWTANGASKTEPRYFKWERIKWRVLYINDDPFDGNMLLMSDKALECFGYFGNNYNGHLPWKISDVRSYLNGYGENYNGNGFDYSDIGKNFLSLAFSNAEKKDIMKTNVNNRDTGVSGSAGSDNTEDKVFLLSYADVLNSEYGFNTNSSAQDDKRKIGYTDYSHAMGAVSTRGNCTQWWLRSYANENSKEMCVKDDGTLTYQAVNLNGNVIVPAITVKYNKTEYLYEDDYETGAGGGYNKYCINYVLDGGKNAESNPAGYIATRGTDSFADPVKEGCVFKGWYRDDKFTRHISSVSIYESGDLTVYAKWKRINTISAKDKNKKIKATVQKIKLNAKNSCNIPMLYTSSEKKVKVDSDGVVTIPQNWCGLVGITITAPETATTIEATKTIYLGIAPEKVEVTKVTAGKKGTLNISWKKLPNVNGYKIIYSTQKNMSACQSIEIKKGKTTKATLKKLTKKTYYIQICAYKESAAGRVYSDWSKKKSCKVK